MIREPRVVKPWEFWTFLLTLITALSGLGYWQTNQIARNAAQDAVEHHNGDRQAHAALLADITAKQAAGDRAILESQTEVKERLARIEGLLMGTVPLPTGLKNGKR